MNIYVRNMNSLIMTVIFVGEFSVLIDKITEGNQPEGQSVMSNLDIVQKSIGCIK